MVILNLKLFNISYYLSWKFSVGISQKTFPVVMLGLSRWWQLEYFLNFHPGNWGNGSIWLAHIFQMGWFNHQLVILLLVLICSHHSLMTQILNTLNAEVLGGWIWPQVLTYCFSNALIWYWLAIFHLSGKFTCSFYMPFIYMIFLRCPGVYHWYTCIITYIYNIFSII